MPKVESQPQPKSFEKPVQLPLVGVFRPLVDFSLHPHTPDTTGLHVALTGEYE